jgi:hypothetical protein
MLLYRLYEQQEPSQQPSGGSLMRKLLLSLTAASAIVAAASTAPAQAMGVGAAPGIQVAVENATVMEDAAYICRHRYYSSRRACFWRPGYGGGWRHRGWRRRW